MVNPFELIEKFPPKRTLSEKIGGVIVIGILVAILALAGFGVYFLITVI